MNIYWFTLIFTAWYVFALVVSEKLGKYRRIGEEWSFFLSMMFSPLLGLVITMMTRPVNGKYEENQTNGLS